MEVIGLFGGLMVMMLSFLPLIFAILVLKWLYTIKQNSDEQVRQNRELIRLLKEKDSQSGT